MAPKNGYACGTNSKKRINLAVFRINQTIVRKIIVVKVIK